MKYRSANILKDFEFHDALFELLSFENNILTISCKYLNIHKNTLQNQFDTDMEIVAAKITFKDFRLLSYCSEGKLKSDSNGGYYAEKSEEVFSDAVAYEKLLNELKAGVTVLDFGTLDNKNCFIDGIGATPWFSVQFLFDCAAVEWDEFKRPAWYEQRTVKQ